MDRGSKTLILGIAIGAVAVTLALRLRQLAEDADPELLAEKITDDLRQLEEHLRHPQG